MKMVQVQKKARTLGVKSSKIKKPDLIHAIQTAEHYTPCYGNANGQCSQLQCCFRDDCLKVKS